MIVQAFLRWVETARTTERAKAANALARAFLQSRMQPDERRAAHVAMTYLLDDPSPQVRLALAEALADSPESPRTVIVPLAEDQLEIACTVILRSPVLTDSDLVDLVGRGSDFARALIAARPALSRGVVAALAELGDVEDSLILLENPTAHFTRLSLRRLAERHGHCGAVRGLLLDREDLPADAHHVLLQHVTEALSGSGLVQAAVGARRIERLAREANVSAALTIAGSVAPEDRDMLVEHLRASGRLTPAFLMHMLCSGKTDFFAAAIGVLSGLEERRVRSILSSGRFHAVRALLESAGLVREISAIFVEAVLLWRRAMQSPAGLEIAEISRRLIQKFRNDGPLCDASAQLLDMVEKIHMAEERRFARDYASGLALAAA